MRLENVGESACDVCGAKIRLKRIDWERGGASPIVLCGACREKLLAMLSGEPKDTSDEATVLLTGNVLRVMREAKSMTEEEFSERYLSDPVDMVIFQYVRGYGRAAIDAAARSALSFMTERGPEVVHEHIIKLTHEGVLYKLEGRTGWYGADYPFADEK